MNSEIANTFSEIAKNLGVDFALVSLIVVLVDRVKELLKITTEEAKEKYKKLFPLISLALATGCALIYHWSDWPMVIKTAGAYFIGSSGLYNIWKLYLKHKPEIEEIKKALKKK